MVDDIVIEIDIEKQLVRIDPPEGPPGIVRLSH
jgi:hypothetical protein